MKKSLLLLSFLSILSIGAFAQCTPATVGNAGIYPDSATNFMPAYQGQAYSQLITVKVPQDTVAPPLGTIVFDKIVLNSITGLPQGLSHSCVPSNCEFPGNATNCAIITGTTNDPVGEYVLTIKVTPYFNILGTVVPYAEETISYYKIMVNPFNSTQSLNPNNFSVSQNTPNPSDNACDIYYTLTSKADVEIRLMNAIGKEVQRIKTNGISGVNKYELNTTNLPQGIYFYSLFNGQTTVTKRLVVNH
ncbi:MAG TPA: T9SS type A sorting domain-containing protein [Bacteroidia bacterium]|nr:T9SS type A sorting domain-containing protein [Bacteroidia bacterium]